MSSQKESYLAELWTFLSPESLVPMAGEGLARGKESTLLEKDMSLYVLFLQFIFKVYQVPTQPQLRI